MPTVLLLREALILAYAPCYFNNPILYQQLIEMCVFLHDINSSNFLLLSLVR